VTRLRAGFVAAASREWFAPLGEALLLDGFAAVTGETFARLLAWEREALAAGYERPA